VAAILEKGPVKAIAISHPHFYTAAILWSRALGCKIVASARDKDWFTMDNNDEAWEWFEGDEHAVASGVKVIRCGGESNGYCTTERVFKLKQVLRCRSLSRLIGPLVERC
jgi:hypothetical protein